MSFVVYSGEEQLLEKQISGKIRQHQIVRTKNLLELFLQQEYIQPDGTRQFFATDGEPSAPTRDFRRAFEMLSCKKGSYAPVYEARPLKSAAHAQLQRSQSEIAPVEERAQRPPSSDSSEEPDTIEERIKRDVKKYNIIDLTPKQELDTYIETLRVLKQRELENLKEQDRMRLLREEQMREHRKMMQKLSHLRDRDAFTYDYDGSVIIQKVAAEVDDENVILGGRQVVTLEHKIRNPQDANALQQALSKKDPNAITEGEQGEEEDEDDDDDDDEEEDDYAGDGSKKAARRYEWAYVPEDPRWPHGKKVRRKIKKKKPQKKGPPKPPMRKGPDYSGQVDVPLGWVPPNVMEKFRVAEGVTLKERSQAVSGQAIEAPIDLRPESLHKENSVLLQPRNARPQIRMTKQQYQQWIQNSAGAQGGDSSIASSSKTAQAHAHLQHLRDDYSEAGNDLGSFLFSEKNRKKFYALSEKIGHKSFKDLKQPDGGSIQVHRASVLIDAATLPSS